MRAYLKIKVVSLAAEARLIRRDERRHLEAERRNRRSKPSEYENMVSGRHGRIYHGLRDHRIGIVRDEARAVQLAYGFLRGLEYSQMEGSTTRKAPPKSRVLELVKKYGEGSRKDLEDSLKLWWDGKTSIAQAA